MDNNYHPVEDKETKPFDEYYYRPKRKRRSRLKITGLVLLMAIFLGAGYSGYRHWRLIKSAEDNSVADIPLIENPSTASPSNPSTAPVSIPAAGMLVVPFTTQAPFANWDATHEEACEEASLIMLYHYQNGTSIDSTASADKEILDLTNWETNNGYAPDVSLEQLSDIAKKYFDMDSSRIITDVTVDNIKKEISAGHPIVVPAAGKVLPNPNFRNGGPAYHMLVIIGYDQTDFITNDPGTRKGQNFRYSYDGLLNAVHNWNPDNILNGPKELLVFD